MKHALFALKILSVVLLSFLSGTALAFGIGTDPITMGMGASITSLAIGFTRHLLPAGIAMASVIDISDLVTEYEAWYKGDANRRQKLKDMLYNTGNKFDEHFMTVPTDNTREEFAYSEQSEVLQPYQVAWTDKGNHTIKPNPAKLFWAKMDIEYVPDHLVLSWAGFLRSNNLSVDQCPFVQYVIENHIIPRGMQDWYLQVAFLGNYAAPTPGTAGAAGTTADGVRELIREKVTDGAMTPFSLGAPPTDPVEFCQYMEEYAAQIPEQHRGRTMTFRMREELRLRYLEGFNELHNKYFLRQGVDINKMPIYQYPNLTVEGFENMGSSDMIFIAPKENSWKLVKGSAKKEILKVEMLKRELYLFTDFHAGYFFPDPREVWVNDQDLS